MTPFTVVVIDRNRKRHRFVALARCWYDAWKTATSEYGIAALVMVKPWKAAP